MSNRTTAKNTAILLLSIALVISLVYIFKLHNERNKIRVAPPGVRQRLLAAHEGLGPVDDKLATREVIRFRSKPCNESGANSYGVYYSAEDLRYYLDSIYPEIVSAEEKYFREKGQDWSKYDWKLGFYWLYKPDRDNILKTDFCFVPTLVNKNDKYDALDYFVEDSAFYAHDLSGYWPDGAAMKVDTPRGKSPGYNTGTMFP